MDGWIDRQMTAWMARWMHKQNIRALDVTVKTNPRRTPMKTHSHIDTVGPANIWLLTGVPARPASYLFIGHFMRDSCYAAKFGAPTNKQQGRESCFCQQVRELTE